MNALQKTFAGVKRFYDGKFSTLYVVKERDGQLCVWEPLFLVISGNLLITSMAFYAVIRGDFGLEWWLWVCHVLYERNNF